MNTTDLGLLIDFLRGELDATAAAEVRARLEHEDALFQLFERLRRTYAVLRSMPAVAPRTGDAHKPETIPLTEPRAAFVRDVRREFMTRGWAGLIPMLAARPEYIRALRVEFTVRAVTGCLPLLQVGASFLEALRVEFAARTRVLALPFVKARPEWVRALRLEFKLRAITGSLPLLDVRPEYAAALRLEFSQRALVGSVPALDVRAGFERRLKVALVESAHEGVAARPMLPAALPVVEAADSFRRRLFKKIRLSGRRKVREAPVRVDIDEYQWGREIKSGLKKSRSSVAFTLSLHVLAIGIMLFIFARPDATTVDAMVARGQANMFAAPPEMRSDDAGIGHLPVGRDTPYVSIIDENEPIVREDILDFFAEVPLPERRDSYGELPEPNRETGAADAPARDVFADSQSSLFRLRGASRQQKIEYLGSPELYEALDKSLAWLVRYQLGDGSWGHVNVPLNMIPREPQRRELQKLEMTTAALLALLGDGHSSEKSPSGYDEAVANGINWLLQQQRESGQIGPPGLFNVQVHAMATLALAEEFGLTRNQRLGSALRKACRWLCEVRAGDTGGFPFQIGGEASLTTSVWAYLALATARNVNVPPIDLPQKRIEEFLAWFSVETREGRTLKDAGDVLFRSDLPLSAAVCSLNLFGYERGHEERIQNYLGRFGREYPDFSPVAAGDPRMSSRDHGDPRYVFFGTMAQALNLQRNGRKSSDWYDAFTRTVLSSQRADGSFATTSGYSSLYGEVYQVAFTALSIENPYRVSVINR